jgi:hypothetical protein
LRERGAALRGNIAGVVVSTTRALVVGSASAIVLCAVSSSVTIANLAVRVPIGFGAIEWVEKAVRSRVSLYVMAELGTLNAERHSLTSDIDNLHRLQRCRWRMTRVVPFGATTSTRLAISQ